VWRRFGIETRAEDFADRVNREVLRAEDRSRAEALPKPGARFESGRQNNQINLVAAHVV
jgi:hypothetical protein